MRIIEIDRELRIGQHKCRRDCERRIFHRAAPSLLRGESGPEGGGGRGLAALSKDSPFVFIVSFLVGYS